MRVAGPFQAQEALAEVSTGIDVLGVAFERGPVAFFRRCEFFPLKINIAQLKVMIGVIPVASGHKSDVFHSSPSL